MENRKNLMILTQALTGGGAEKIAANLSLGLDSQMNVYVVTFWQSEKEYEYAGTRINLDINGIGLVGKIFAALKRIRTVKKLKKKLGIDISISVVPPCDYVNVFSKTKNEKTVIDVVSNMSVAFPKGIGRWFRKKVMHKADFLVTVSEGVKTDLVDNFGLSPERIQTIYNAVDIEAVQKASNAEYIPLTEKKYISAMGSFRYPKGHWHLIKAFSTITDEIKDVDLMILGDGAYREKYEALINTLGLEDRIVMPGFLNPPHAYIAHSELFVFSSVFEGFGNVLIEAMACGVPTLSTDCKYGPREILAPQTPHTNVATNIEYEQYGVLVTPFGMDDIDISGAINESERLFGKAIKDLLASAEKRAVYASIGKEYCKCFSNETVSNKWYKLICNLK